MVSFLQRIDVAPAQPFEDNSSPDEISAPRSRHPVAPVDHHLHRPGVHRGRRPRIQESLHISPEQWGWVTSVFFFSYSAFEIPSGALADRIGPFAAAFMAAAILTSSGAWALGFLSLAYAGILFQLSASLRQASFRSRHSHRVLSCTLFEARSWYVTDLRA
jgi:Major Facilitator Superfamily